MPVVHLTDIAVRKLRGSDRYETYWDATTPAFGIRVGVRTKMWTIMRGKSRERITFGRYPDLSLSEARAEAKRLLSAVPEPKTVSKAWEAARDAFIAENYAEGSKTQYQVKRGLERHFKPLVGRSLTDLTDREVERCLAKLADRPSEQLHAFRYARAMLNWSCRPPRRWIKVSPLHGYEPPGEDRKGTRTLTDDELTAIWRACGNPRLALFRLLILWGTRNTETCVLEREWATDGVLTIPGEFTKNGRDHAMPVLPLAETVFGCAHGSNQHYFAGRHGSGHLTPGALGKLKKEVMKASGTKDWQLRDIRRTFRTNMRRLGVATDVCEALINHAPAALIEIYDRYHLLPEKRAALASYEAFIQNLMARDQPEPREAPDTGARDEAAIEKATA